MATSTTNPDPNNDPIKIADAPWTCKVTAYMIPFWLSGSAVADGLPAKAYHPLEATSPFASKEFGKPVGGVGLLQILRYADTPVGPYEEMVLCPGFFEYPIDDKNGKKKTRKATRVTRIYVSQKHTTFNGRRLWNLPKHLARFEWTDNPQDGSTHVKVFPHDTAGTPYYDPSESTPNTVPFFQCTIQPMKYVPSFPLNITLLGKLGLDPTLIQPPLPEGTEASQGELAGTELWRDCLFAVRSPSVSLGWADVSQKGEDGKVLGGDEYENFFPGLKRWNVAFKWKDATVTIDAGKSWETPRSLL